MTTAVSRRASHSMALVALFAALMAVMGLIPKIDLPMGVPITLQSLGVMLAGCLLGARRGLQAMLLFLAAVAAGLPLLAGGRGGLGVFMVPSAGYLVGYALAAGVTGALMRVLPHGTPRRTALSAFIASLLGGLVFLHAMGIAGLMLLAQMPLDKAIMIDLAFVPGDLAKCVLCALVVHTVARALPDWPFGGRER
ncbi:biotin transporter BioY [Diaphorobacter sp.]|uniref:biotin transporter BioY n=1 Tax=Diaphorobacter sp. TaxID=1934310 RepID=UPI003D099158